MKNYTFLPLLIVLLISLNSYSQNFAPIGATWHYSANNSEPPWDVNYILIESIKDTLVLGKNAKKLNTTHYSAGGDTILGETDIIYSDSNKVYLYRYNQFHLLYDFNANQGDTIYMIEPLSWGGCGGNNDTLIEVLVDSVKIENIGGVMKKVQYVRNLEFGWGIGGKFIESVGSDFYLFPIYCTFPPGIGPLRCYKDSLINYQLVPDCEELVVGIDKTSTLEQPTLLIYPNPSSGIFNVEMNAEQAEIEIFNITGQRVKQTTLNSYGIFDISNQPKGLYLIKIATSTETIVRKVILQ